MASRTEDDITEQNIDKANGHKGNENIPIHEVPTDDGTSTQRNNVTIAEPSSLVTDDTGFRQPTGKEILDTYNEILNSNDKGKTDQGKGKNTNTSNPIQENNRQDDTIETKCDNDFRQPVGKGILGTNNEISNSNDKGKTDQGEGKNASTSNPIQENNRQDDTIETKCDNDFRQPTGKGILDTNNEVSNSNDKGKTDQGEGINANTSNPIQEINRQDDTIEIKCDNDFRQPLGKGILDINNEVSNSNDKGKTDQGEGINANTSNPIQEINRQDDTIETNCDNDLKQSTGKGILDTNNEVSNSNNKGKTDQGEGINANTSNPIQEINRQDDTIETNCDNDLKQSTGKGILGTNNEVSNSNNKGKTDQGEAKNANTSNLIQENNRQYDTIETDCNKGTNTQHSSSKDNIIEKSSEIPNDQEDKISQDENGMVKICQSWIDGERKGNKAKGKKRPSELALLGIDIKKSDDEDSDSKYDVFGDDSKIFRKYKLRKTEQQISYKEPTDLKPKRRVSSDDEPNSLDCLICNRDFETKRALQLHIRFHKDTVPEYTCSLCSKKFDKNSELIAHRSMHSSESFLCEKCKLAFSDYCDFLLHNYEHLNRPRFKCAECGLHYRKSVYKLHVLTHFDKKVSCHLCSFVTNGEFNLRSHLNQHNYKLTCVECGKVLNNKKDYEYHMSTHTGVKKFQCLYCGACFRQNGAREVHTRIHTGEKPYTCNICGHKSRQSGDLKRHKETHDIEKKHTCELCGKKYFHKEYLAIHMRSHTKSSLYECPECDAKFVGVAGLKTHTMFKHTSERPVECTLCDKKFINNNQYQKHCRAKYHQRNVYGHTKNKEKGNE